MQTQTTPLAKAITTLEGQLITASSVLIAAFAALDPRVLSPKYAATLVTAQHVALLAQRGLVKIKASKQVNEVIDAPDPVKEVEAEVESALTTAPAPVAPLAMPESARTPDIPHV